MDQKLVKMLLQEKKLLLEKKKAIDDYLDFIEGNDKKNETLDDNVEEIRFKLNETSKHVDDYQQRLIDAMKKNDYKDFMLCANFVQRSWTRERELKWVLEVLTQKLQI